VRVRATPWGEYTGGKSESVLVKREVGGLSEMGWAGAGRINKVGVEEGDR
jgi:hypothetical protein